MNTINTIVPYVLVALGAISIIVVIVFIVILYVTAFRSIIYRYKFARYHAQFNYLLDTLQGESRFEFECDMERITPRGWFPLYNYDMRTLNRAGRVIKKWMRYDRLHRR